jgi:Tfp pilus assembly protein PilF
MKRLLVFSVLFSVLSSLSYGQTNKSRTDAQKAYEQGLASLKEGLGVKPVEKALESFKKAVTLDPEFAAAYAQLSLAYSSLGGNYNYWPPDLTGPQSLQAAEKAVALDENLAEAHLAQAAVKVFYQWDWSGAERSVKRAMSLEPDNANILMGYASFLLDMNRLDEADALFLKTQKLELPSQSVYAFKVLRTSDKSELAQLINAQEKQLAQQPPEPYSLWMQALANTKAGDYAKAERCLEQQIPLMEGDIVDELGLSGHVCGRLGRKSDALKRLAQLDELEKKNQYVSPVLRAWIYIGLADKDKAFLNLDKAFEQRAHRLGLQLKGFNFLYDTVRDDARFISLMKRSNLQ